MSGRRREFIMLAVMALCCAALWMVPGPPPLAHDGARRVRARVIKVDDAALRQHGLLRFGSQLMEVQILSGEHRGERFTAVNEIRAQMELDKYFAPGDCAVVVMPAADGTAQWRTGKNGRGGHFCRSQSVLVAQDHWRTGWSLFLFALFCLLLCLFGGWTGAKALFSFVLSCLVIWKMVIPLALRGWPASWTVFAAVCFLTAAICYLVAGPVRKGTVALLGSGAGVLAGLMMARLFTALMKINGATLPYAQALLYGGYESLNLSDIFVGAMILASSGAVMDLGMDIAAGVEEVARHNPGLPRRELLWSGLRIGRSVVGTMTTTLLLAYSGGYITLLMMFCAQGTPVADLLNNPLVASEAVKTLIGSFSLVLVAPFTAVAAAWLYGRSPGAV